MQGIIWKSANTSSYGFIARVALNVAGSQGNMIAHVHLLVYLGSLQWYVSGQVAIVGYKGPTLLASVVCTKLSPLLSNHPPPL